MLIKLRLLAEPLRCYRGPEFWASGATGDPTKNLGLRCHRWPVFWGLRWHQWPVFWVTGGTGDPKFWVSGGTGDPTFWVSGGTGDPILEPLSKTDQWLFCIKEQCGKNRTDWDSSVLPQLVLQGCLGPLPTRSMKNQLFASTRKVVSFDLHGL